MFGSVKYCTLCLVCGGVGMQIVEEVGTGYCVYVCGCQCRWLGGEAKESGRGEGCVVSHMVAWEGRGLRGKGYTDLCYAVSGVDASECGTYNRGRCSRTQERRPGTRVPSMDGFC